MAINASGEGSGDTLNIDMTPLIDVTFLLLIFFMTISSFNEMERTAELQLPVAFQAQVEDDVSKRRMVINIEKDGQIVLYNQRMNMAQFENKIEKYRNSLRKLAEKTGQAPIVIRGDKGTEYENIKGVLSKVYEERFERVMFAAYQPEDQK